MTISQGCRLLHLQCPLTRRLESPWKLAAVFQRNFSTQRNVQFSKAEVNEDFNHSLYLERQEFPPFVKNLFLGKFNKSILSYAEILNDESYLSLENNVARGEIITWKNLVLNITIIVGEYLETKGDLIEKIDKTR